MTEAIAFYAFGAVAVIFSLMVILLRNPVTSALSLVVSFFCISGIYVLLHAPFLGVIQILIYTGAILVLFLYVTMLLNLKGDGVKVSYERVTKLGALVIMPILILALVRAIPEPRISVATVEATFGSMQSVGERLLGPFVLWFELISVLLLAAIAGAVVLAAKSKEVR